jgi:hypothetical protein
MIEKTLVNWYPCHIICCYYVGLLSHQSYSILLQTLKMNACYLNGDKSTLTPSSSGLIAGVLFLQSLGLVKSIPARCSSKCNAVIDTTIINCLMSKICSVVFHNRALPYPSKNVVFLSQ